MITKEFLKNEVLRNRQTQIMVAEEVNKGTYKVPVHLALGHESVATAIIGAAQELDKFTFTHRNIHFHIALGADFDSLDSEYKLSTDGLAGGVLGSMNLTYTAKGNLYTSNILANNLAVSNGLSLSLKVKNEEGVVWAITGDGAIEEGTFYESLLIATSLNLNVIFIVENNRWSLGSEINERRKEISLQKLAESLGIKYYNLSGNNVWNYFNQLRSVRENSLTDGLPSLVEFNVTTLGGYFVEENSRNRYINYHAGRIKINPSSDGIIEENSNDPVYVEMNQA